MYVRIHIYEYTPTRVCVASCAPVDRQLFSSATVKADRITSVAFVAAHPRNASSRNGVARRAARDSEVDYNNNYGLYTRIDPPYSSVFLKNIVSYRIESYRIVSYRNVSYGLDSFYLPQPAVGICVGIRARVLVRSI